MKKLMTKNGKKSTNTSTNNSFGKKLRALGKKAGLTQSEFAFSVGVHETTIRRWEAVNKSTPSVEEVRKLAGVLHVSEQQLLDTEDSSPSEWVLTVKIAHNFREEVLNVGKCIPRKSTIITTEEGGYLCLGGDYSLLYDDNNFKSSYRTSRSIALR